jgi:biopolymer transport protein ExbD
MSHGGDKSCEPNLTPLLDLVLQLVMFFMLVANFKAEQITGAIRLPESQEASAKEVNLDDVLYLNIDEEGKLIVSGRDNRLATPAEISLYLKQQYKEAEEVTKARDPKATEPKTVVIIRADEAAKFSAIYTVLREAKLAGFRKWQLRAYLTGRPA